MLATMTETKPEASAPPEQPQPRLWTPAGFREDEWTHAESAEALVGNGRIILPLQAFLDLDPEQRKSARASSLSPGCSSTPSRSRADLRCSGSSARKT